MKFLSAIAFLFTYSLIAQDVPTDKWVRTELTDAFAGTKYSRFTLRGKFLTPPKNPADGMPLWVIDCVAKENHSGKYHFDGLLRDSHINIGSVLDFNLYGVMVSYRLDDGKERVEAWQKSTDATSIFLDRQRLNTLLYVHSLPHRQDSNPAVKKVLISVVEAYANQVVVEFDIPDPTEVASVCGVTYHK